MTTGFLTDEHFGKAETTLSIRKWLHILVHTKYRNEMMNCYLYKFSVSSIVDGKGFPFVSGSTKQSRPARIARDPKRTTGRLTHTSSRINRSGTRIPPTRDAAENQPSPLLLLNKRAKHFTFITSSVLSFVSFHRATKHSWLTWTGQFKMVYVLLYVICV